MYWHIESIFLHYKGQYSLNIMADQCCLDLCTGCDCGELCGNVCSILLCYQCFQNCGECNCHCGSSKRGRHAYVAAPQKEPKQQRMSRDAELVF